MVVNYHASRLHLVLDCITYLHASKRSTLGPTGERRSPLLSQAAHQVFIQDVRLVLLVPPVVQLLLFHEGADLDVAHCGDSLLKHARGGALPRPRRPCDQDVGQSACHPADES